MPDPSDYSFAEQEAGGAFYKTGGQSTGVSELTNAEEETEVGTDAETDAETDAPMATDSNREEAEEEETALLDVGLCSPFGDLIKELYVVVSAIMTHVGFSTAPLLLIVIPDLQLRHVLSIYMSYIVRS